MFAIDRYIPKEIKDLTFNEDIWIMLKKMCSDESIPHILLYGTEGSGKKTTVQMILENIYDSSINKMSNVQYKICGSGNKPNYVDIKQSNYHLVIEPNNTNFDRYLIQEIVKKYAKYVPLNVFDSKRGFKTVVISNIDNLSYYAQTSLRRTMEKYSGTCRFIVWGRSLSKIIDPLKSRCLCIRLSAPTDTQLLTRLIMIEGNDNIFLKHEKFREIIKKAKGNMRDALWLYELAKRDISLNTSYDDELHHVVELILNGDIKELMNIRDCLYKIMVTTIDGCTIMKDIVNLLLRQKLPFKFYYNLIAIASKFNSNLARGRRDIIHLEGFIISLLASMQP